MPLSTRILIGLGLGALTGLVAKLGGFEWLEATLGALEPLGTAFIRLITMVVIPLVVASLLVGTATLGDLRKLGRMGGKTLGYYLLTTALAVRIGIAVSAMIRPGSRIDPDPRDRLAARVLLGAAELSDDDRDGRDVLRAEIECTHALDDLLKGARRLRHSPAITIKVAHEVADCIGFFRVRKALLQHAGGPQKIFISLHP